MLIREFDPTKLSDRLKMKAVAARRPLSCTFELTYHCNFRCPMCYIRMTDEQAKPFGRLRTADEWISMAQQCYEAGVLYLTLTGGECTIFPEFPRLYQTLYEMDFRVSLMSNAGHYSDELKQLFREYPPYGVSITLYGGSNETYEAVTGDSKGLDHVLENIRFLQSIRVPINLNFTMIRQNVRDYPLVGAICKDLGIPYTVCTDITTHGRNAAYSDALNCRLSSAQRACVACHPPEEVDLALENAEELELETALHELATVAVRESEAMNECIGSCSSAAIFWNGEMGNCISMTGNQRFRPFELGFETAWQQIQLEHGQQFRKPALCVSCRMQEDCIHNCAARNYEGTGDCQIPDPANCRYVQLLRYYRVNHPTGYGISSPNCK